MSRIENTAKLSAITKELTDESEHMNKGLFFSRYPNWKRIRAIHSPSFSTGKLKAMKPMIEKTMDQLIAKLDPKASDQQIVDFRHYYDSLTFDVITRAAAGELDYFNPLIQTASI
ncbi:unnamed protein product [Oppiella nova]|uniref:Cytochrome P450 n=1 Tax=Oppiella nova TaxID=334625 RepID=A0A7R9QW79_9ACAR|nr:unnamed protein product [Oppiella nova]CAG2176267.1 unnamed protein product [Oppiella nova]